MEINLLMPYNILTTDLFEATPFEVLTLCGFLLLFYALFVVVEVLPRLESRRRRIRSRRVYKAISTRTESLPIQEFLQLLPLFGSAREKAGFVQLIKERNLLLDNPRSIEMLTGLVAQLQHDLIEAGSGSEVDEIWYEGSAAFDSFDQWYTDFLIWRETQPRSEQSRYGRALTN